MIFVTTGTNKFHITEFLEKMDDIASRLDEEVVMQVGFSGFEGKNTKCYGILKEDEIVKMFDEASIIIGFPGIGTMLNALNRNIPMVITYDIPEYRIREDAILVAEIFEEMGRGIVANLDKLEEAINKAKTMKMEPYKKDNRMCEKLSVILDDYSKEIKR